MFGKSKNPKYVSREEALSRLQALCAKQDRSHKEIHDKLHEWGIFYNDADQIVGKLIEDNFLNEERYARSYARGKFRMNAWGRRRIVQELKMERVSEYCIRKALTEIREDDYLETLQQVIDKKMSQLDKEEHPSKTKMKAAAYAIGRGFESELVWKLLNFTGEE